MADPLSLAASIFAVVAIADRAFALGFKFVKGIKDASDDIRSLVRELQFLAGVLHSLSIVAQALEERSSDSAFRPHHVEACYHSLSSFKSRMEKAKDEIEGGSKLKAVSRKLKWPFTTSETKQLLSEISRHKQTMTVALSADTIAALMDSLTRQNATDKRLEDIAENVRKNLSIATRIEFTAKRRLVLNFFLPSSVDTQQGLDTSRQLRQPFTGLWLTKGVAFTHWLEAPNSRLWATGIPGAGKTILAGAMVEEIMHRSDDPLHAILYYFCDYNNANSTNPLAVLSSFAAQLAKQNADAMGLLEEYYDQLKGSSLIDTPVEIDGVSAVLSKMMTFFSRVFVVVDGLDETGDKAGDVLYHLLELFKKANHSSIIISSRDEQIIRDHLEEAFDQVEISAHSDDIELYAVAKIDQLTRSRRLKIRNPDLKATIIDKLVDGSRGMFRWVTCQIDLMCDLPSDAARLRALDSLPFTLSETYVRLLKRVDASDEQTRCLVEDTLALISFTDPSLSIDELCEAVSFGHEVDTLRPQDLVTEDEIARRCSSLIRRSNDGLRFEFAHFTVPEFLRNLSSDETSLRRYGIAQEKPSVSLSRLAIRFLLNPAFAAYELGSCDTGQMSSFRFYDFAARYCWSKIGDLDDPEVKDLVKDLFAVPKTGQFRNWSMCLCAAFYEDLDKWATRNTGVQIPLDIQEALDRQDFTPFHLACILAIPWLCQSMIAEGADLQASSLIGEPLQCAVVGLGLFQDRSEPADARGCHLGNRAQVVHFLLEAGAIPGEHYLPYGRLWPPESLHLEALRQTRYWSWEGVHDVSLFTHLFRASPSVSSSFTTDVRPMVEGMLHATSQNHGKDWTEMFKSLLKDSGLCEDDSKQEFLHMVRVSCTHVLGRMSIPEDPEAQTGPGTFEDWHHQASLAVHYNRAEELDALCKLELRTRVGLEDTASAGLMHSAIYWESLNALKALLTAGFDIEARDENQRTPLLCCVRNSTLPLLRVLVDSGADVTASDSQAQSLWHLAIGQSESSEIIDFLSEVVGSEEQCRQLERCDDAGRTPLDSAMERESPGTAFSLVKIIGSQGSTLTEGVTLFWKAAKFGDTQLVKTLVDITGEDLDSGDATDTPLHHLSPAAEVECIRILQALFPAPRRDTDKRTALEKVLARCLEHGTIYFSSRHEACLGELARHDLVDSYDHPQGQMTWDYFCATVWTRMPCSDDGEPLTDTEVRLDCEGCVYNISGLVDFLLQSGAMGAYEKAHKRCGLIPFLAQPLARERFRRLRLGEDILLPIIEQSKHWDTARHDPDVLLFLQSSVDMQWKRAVAALLGHGVSAHSRVDGYSALEVACWPGIECGREIFEMLLVSHTKEKSLGWGETKALTHLGKPGVTDSLWKLSRFLEHGADANMALGVFQTPLLHFHLGASCSGEEAIVLLESGADPAQTDSRGMNSIHVAAYNGHLGYLQAVEALGVGREVWTSVARCPDSGLIKDHGGWNVLHMAVLGMHHRILDFLLGKGLIESLNEQTGWGLTYLHVAAISNDRECLVTMHRAGSTRQIEKKDSNGFSPLAQAVASGKDVAVQALVDLGAEGIDRALNGAIEHDLPFPSVIRILQSALGQQARGARSAARGRSRLMKYAIVKGDLPACQALFQNGYSLLSPLPPCYHCSPLLWSIRLEKFDIAKWLVGQRPSLGGQECAACASNTLWRRVRNDYRCNALEMATLYSSASAAEFLELLLPMYDPLGDYLQTRRSSALHHASMGNNLRGLQLLLKQLGPPLAQDHGNPLSSCSRRKVVHGDRRWRLVNAKDWFGMTPLHWAIVHSDVEFVELLLESGASPDARDDTGDTALCLAVTRQRDELIGVLLKYGASPDLLTYSGMNPIMLAASRSMDYIRQMSERHRHLDINSRTQLGDSALHFARPETFAFLLSLGMDPHLQNTFGITPAHLGLVRHPGVSLFLQLDSDEYPQIPWRSLCTLFPSSHSSIHIFTKLRLLQRRYKGPKHRLVDFEPCEGITPLCFSVLAGFQPGVAALLEAGAPLDAEGCDQGSALMAACSQGDIETIKYLVHKGASVFYVNEASVHRSAVAAVSRNHDIVHWLLVDRFTEQGKIASSEAEIGTSLPGSEAELSCWSGVGQCRLELVEDLARCYGESTIMYARRLGWLKRNLRGLEATYESWCFLASKRPS